MWFCGESASHFVDTSSFFDFHRVSSDSRVVLTTVDCKSRVKMTVFELSLGFSPLMTDNLGTDATEFLYLTYYDKKEQKHTTKWPNNIPTDRLDYIQSYPHRGLTWLACSWTSLLTVCLRSAPILRASRHFKRRNLLSIHIHLPRLIQVLARHTAAPTQSSECQRTACLSIMTSRPTRSTRSSSNQDDDNARRSRRHLNDDNDVKPPTDITPAAPKRLRFSPRVLGDYCYDIDGLEHKYQCDGCQRWNNTTIKRKPRSEYKSQELLCLQAWKFVKYMVR